MDRFTTLNEFYTKNDEDMRFESKHGQVEYLTTLKYIEKYLEKGMKIIVIQGEKCKEYEKADEIKEICNFSHESYINPSALFVGNVSENANGIISEVSFVLK